MESALSAPDFCDGSLDFLPWHAEQLLLFFSANIKTKKLVFGFCFLIT
jgi:hypothetical protein